MALIKESDSAKLRNIPLDEVAARLGLTGKRDGRSMRYKSEKFNIVITGQEFFDNNHHYGNGGAISLVMHVLGLEYRQAVAWLSGQNHVISASRSTLALFPAPAAPPPCQLSFDELFAKYAARSEESWPAARNYLLRRRCLSPEVVDQLYSRDLIFANDHKPNSAVVFLHRDLNQNVKGFTLRSTYDPVNGKKKFCPCMGDKETAWFYLGDLHAAPTIVVTESPIDAVSYSLLHPQAGAAVVSLAGWYLPGSLFDFIRSVDKQLVVALDNDPLGTHGWNHVLLRYLFLAAEQSGAKVMADLGCEDFTQFRLFLDVRGHRPDYSFEDVKKLLGVALSCKIPVQFVLPDDFKKGYFRDVPVSKDWNADLVDLSGGSV